MKDAYQDWLRHVFDHEVTKDQWFFEVDAPEFRAEPIQIVELMTKTMQRSGTDLAGYSDDQVGQGLNYVFSNSCSNLSFAVFDGSVGLNQKLEVLRSIAALYKDCFEPRCRPALGHLSEPDASRPLNYICYMFWDVTPLAYWDGKANEEKAYEVVLDVLAEALNSSNIACVESAVHGLGHVHSRKLGSRVKRILGAFEPKLPDNRLLPYVQAAATGCVL